jgi:hypothetical protein
VSFYTFFLQLFSYFSHVSLYRLCCFVRMFGFDSINSRGTLHNWNHIYIHILSRTCASRGGKMVQITRVEIQTWPKVTRRTRILRLFPAPKARIVSNDDREYVTGYTHAFVRRTEIAPVNNMTLASDTTGTHRSCTRFTYARIFSPNGVSDFAQNASSGKHMRKSAEVSVSPPAKNLPGFLAR